MTFPKSKFTNHSKTVPIRFPEKFKEQLTHLALLLDAGYEVRVTARTQDGTLIHVIYTASGVIEIDKPESPVTASVTVKPPIPINTALLEDFVDRLFKMWRSIVVSSQTQSPWGTPLPIEQIFDYFSDEGLSPPTITQYLERLLNPEISIEFPWACQIEFMNITHSGELVYHLNHQPYSHFSFHRLIPMPESPSPFKLAFKSLLNSFLL